MYFAIYQALAEDERREGLFKQFAPDFFDLIIVDECHRGSARDDSSWRAILEYFEPAFQLGMTATPLRDDNRDTYLYFGNPIYEYSLRQGIDDGFLAPYRVHRVVTEWDAAGWRPSASDLDRYGRAIPDDEYQTKDFERVVALRARTEAIARHLTEFLKKTDRFAKTIVFCVDQEHADEMRRALNNLNSDLAAQHPDYVCRVTSDEGDIGRGHLSRFQDVDTKVPTILTTSQLLTTGVDAPTCKNVVLARVVGSMSEFKQIIGRGTRVRDDYGKLWFNIIDYTGSATRLFADPAFDGDPMKLTAGRNRRGRQCRDDHGRGRGDCHRPRADRRRHGRRSTSRRPRSGGNSTSTAARSKSPRISSMNSTRTASSCASIRYTDYAAEKVRTLCPTAPELRAEWADPAKRCRDHPAACRSAASTSTNWPTQAKQPDADPFDLLCHLAFNAPLRTRRERAQQLARGAQGLLRRNTPGGPADSR